MSKDKDSSNKYSAQERWQKRNGYISKSYRLEKEAIEKLSVRSSNEKRSIASILNASLTSYIKINDFSEFIKEYDRISSQKKTIYKKTFKIKKDISDKILYICHENNYKQGAFISTIIYLYN